VIEVTKWSNSARGEQGAYFLLPISLRDWFAGMAISPMLAARVTIQAYGSHPDVLAQSAYVIADAMLAEREKERP